jgi:hypothetical protein
LEVSAPMEPGGGENASRHVAIRSRSRSQWQDMSSQAVAKLVFGCACASLALRIIPLAFYPEAFIPKTESRAKGAGQNRVVEAGGEGTSFGL